MALVCRKSGDDCYGIKEINLLFDISKKLHKIKDIKESLYPVVEMTAKYLKADRAFLTILNRNSSQINIEVAYGLTEKEINKGIYKVGEGIIGKVVETGTSIVIPQISKSKGFLNKTGSRTKINNLEVSFICVPIKEENEIAGTLSINKVYNENISFTEDERLLSVIGSMIAQAVRARQEYLEEIARLKEENLKLHDELKAKLRPTNIVGTSGNMQAVFNLISRVAPTNATVLIRGESGVGKELIADTIHFNSLRAGNAFIKVNCAALPESLIESELFGHEKGAFTGADVMRKGRFEMAEGGTIFLDEIGDLPASTQIKLLRILQSREFERLGSTKPIKVDVRIVTATNRDLEDLITKGQFREDLFYRINVFPLFIPPLRERATDIPTLVDHFIGKFNKEHNTNIKRISSSAIDLLMIYHWPGNIRELENCIERACILSSDKVIHSYNLPPTLQTAQSSHTKSKGTLNAIIDRVERQMLIETLQSTKGNMIKAAEILDITERMMGIRIKKYEIDPKRFKVVRE
jgi:Nif-specific regulatory protein